MRKQLRMVFPVLFLFLVSAPSAIAFGEDVLAHTGEYTFFIKPKPGSHVTYRQRMVPCAVREHVPVPTKTSITYPVPIPEKRRHQMVIIERPVGCAADFGPCKQCFPRAYMERSSRNKIYPRMLPVRVSGTVFSSKCVTRRVMRPMWYEVRETPVPTRPVRKVGKTRPIRKVGTRG